MSNLAGLLAPHLLLKSTFICEQTYFLTSNLIVPTFLFVKLFNFSKTRENTGVTTLSENLVLAREDHILVLREVAHHGRVCGFSESTLNGKSISLELVIALNFVDQEHQSGINRVFEQSKNIPKCHPLAFHADVEGV